jgi:hypothetical protein
MAGSWQLPIACNVRLHPAMKLLRRIPFPLVPVTGTTSTTTVVLVLRTPTEYKYECYYDRTTTRTSTSIGPSCRTPNAPNAILFTTENWDRGFR